MTRTENRSSRRWIVAGTAVALLAFVTAGAWAMGPRHGRPMSGELHEFMLNKVLDQADATDEQREQIAAIMTAAHDDVEALREGYSRHDLHERMIDLLTAETIDETAINALGFEFEQMVKASKTRMLDAVVESASLLSQEQRVAVAEGMRERFERHGGRGRHGRDE